MSTEDPTLADEEDHEPRFGENFNPDHTNRLDVLRGREALPEPVKLAREIRDKLKLTVDSKNPDAQGWPECPSDVRSVEDFFARSKNVVETRWADSVKTFLDEKTAEWLAEIPDTEEYEELRETLSDSDRLERDLGMQDMSAFENLRTVLPEAWRSLVLVSSERQLAAVELSRHWIREMPAESLETLGVAREELNLLLDCAALTGKYLDQAYVKQIELADAPGGSVKTKLGHRVGAKYIYDIQPDPDNDLVEKKPFKDVFPFEFPRIVSRLQELARRTEQLIAAGKLPNSYKNFPAYLMEMANVYGSSSVSPKELDRMWQNLQASYVRLAKEGCPIMLIPQSCPMASGDAEKVDVEIRLGFQTPSTRKLSRIIDESTPIAQRIIDQHQDAFSEPNTFPPVIPNIQPFAFGPNLHFYTEGQSEKEVIMLHTNVSAESAAKVRIPLIRKLFDQTDIVDDQLFKELSGGDTAFHEMGHAVFTIEDSGVKKRIGSGNDAWLLEETKAETIGIELMLRGLERAEPADKEEFLRRQLLIKFGTIAEYVSQNSSQRGSGGERYYFAGVAVLKALFDRGVLVDNGGRYEITDAEEGFKAIAEVGKGIIDKFYTNTADKPADVRKSVKAFVAGLRKQEKDTNVAEFIRRAKA